MKHVPIAVALVLVLALPAGLSAAEVAQTQGPQPIYAAFSLVRGEPRSNAAAPTRSPRDLHRHLVSPDPRMAGEATYVGQISARPSGQTGIANGTLTIRNGARRRMRATVSGVFTDARS